MHHNNNLEVCSQDSWELWFKEWLSEQDLKSLIKLLDQLWEDQDTLNKPLHNNNKKFNKILNNNNVILKDKLSKVVYKEPAILLAVNHIWMS